MRWGVAGGLSGRNRRMATGTLIIARPREYAARLRRYRIIVDDQEVGRLKLGEGLRIEMPEGEHWMVARIDWTQKQLSLVWHSSRRDDRDRGWIERPGSGRDRRLLLRHDRLSELPLSPAPCDRIPRDDCGREKLTSVVLGYRLRRIVLPASK